MPALLEDPTSPVIYRAVGQGPYPSSTNPQIPSSIFPRPVTLRDRVTIATLIPFFSPDAVPPRLLAYLCDNLNKEIKDGNTYPMMDGMSVEVFGRYWFANFGAVMVLGDIGGIEAVNDMERTEVDWSKLCLGSFYVKPNYPGRSSHICNGGFLVTPAARNKGVGKSMGQCYLDWAPQLGYTYSVFNLVYESNTASTRIWDSLGFKRIGRVPACGMLRSSAEPVDAIIYGRDLKAEEGDVENEERFDKIRYYLRHSLYPQGADRSEKSRLRSAATHYKLIPAKDGVPEKLMLKGKEVISDPAQQYEIAKQMHLINHKGINKTTAVIATQYHWVRIKETASHVIKNCPECKDTHKPPILRSEGTRASRSKTMDSQTGPPEIQQKPMQPGQQDTISQPQMSDPMSSNQMADDMHPAQLSDELRQPRVSQDGYDTGHLTSKDFQQVEQSLQLHDDDDLDDNDPQLVNYDDMAIDPQIIQQLQAQLASEYDPNQQHPAFVQSGMPHYADPSHLTQGHPHQSQNDFTSTHPHQSPNDFTSPRSHQTTNEFATTQRQLNGHSGHFLSPHNTGMMGHHPQPSPDHVMGNSDDNNGPGNGSNAMNNMQQMRHVLQMEYMNGPSPTDGHDPFKQ